MYINCRCYWWNGRINNNNNNNNNDKLSSTLGIKVQLLQLSWKILNIIDVVLDFQMKYKKFLKCSIRTKNIFWGSSWPVYRKIDNEWYVSSQDEWTNMKYQKFQIFGTVIYNFTKDNISSPTVNLDKFKHFENNIDKKR